MFLQSVGLLPDNVIVLTASRVKSEDRIKEKLRKIGNTSDLQTTSKFSVDESELHISAVKEIYKGFYSELNNSEKNKSEIIDEIAVRN